MLKKLLKWEGWGFADHASPQPLEQDPGFEPSANRPQGFGPGHSRSFARLGLLLSPRSLAFQQLGKRAELERSAAEPQGRARDDTSRRKRRNRPIANVAASPDRS